jgi:Ca2+-transporting ATPase
MMTQPPPILDPPRDAAPPAVPAAPWYRQEAAAVLTSLQADAVAGLTAAEAARRLAEYGPNTLTEQGRISPWRILWEQFTGIMVVILIIAAVFSLFLGDYQDTLVILAIVVLNALLGFQQEYRAEQALATLKKLAVPQVRARRDGQVCEIPAAELVPGDLVLLEAGNLVPADGRVLESANLRVQEATLTGESEPVEKDAHARPGADLPLGDRHNMVYLGTLATYGRGQIVVTGTGMQTELGRIAALLQTTDRLPTPLQQRLAQLGRGLAAAALALVAVMIGLGLLRGEDWQLLVLTAMSVAVAAVPEGLPAVVTIALALGAQRMLARQALIRKLPAVETLGSVTVICSDKTGTLTENRMTVTVLDVAGQRVDLSTPLEEDAPTLEPDSRQPGRLREQPDLAWLLAGGALCNDAVLQPRPATPGEYQAVGDPTEGALVVVAARLGLDKTALDAAFPRVAECPFDSARKRMTTLHRLPAAIPPALGSLAGPPDRAWPPAPYLAVTKGAVDGLLAVASHVWVAGQATRLTPEWRERITAANAGLAGRGMRILGVAFRPLAALPDVAEAGCVERDLIFVGLVGMIDPVRPEVYRAVATCRRAGIRPVMITGDHPLTARAIAQDLGIGAGDQVLTGPDLDRLTEPELAGQVARVAIYARVSPEHKLRIVQALQRQAQIVAMTGDGVNDAPALKQADIGVAMGITGTDVAKEAADMVLLDDNFATIVAAVEEGRVIYDNIRKFIQYILAGNIGELWVMLLAPVIGMPLPLLPLQILWINLVTDGLPALALGLEPAERSTMERPPHRPNESIFARGLGLRVLGLGLLTGAASLGVGFGYWATGQAGWQTMVFTTLTLAQMALALTLRSDRDSLFRVGLLKNKPLLGAVALTVALQLALIYLPFLQGIFHTTPLAAGDLLLSLGLSALVLAVVEGEKWLRRRQPERA